MVLPITNPTKSYWIEAADSPLRHHRSTEKLPEHVDVVIIGSGYTGASAAYWFQKFTEHGRTPSMLMLEARGLCEAATGRNGGQLRPHFYSRYTPWKERFGPDVTRKVIEHEAAHLEAFNRLVTDEDIVSATSFKMGETFDAAMSEEALTRLKGALDDMKRDHPDAYITKACRFIQDPKEAEEYTQMKGCLGAIVHPSGQIWPYKFVHELLRITMARGNLNVQADTPVEGVRDGIVSTTRGDVRAKVVLHATNRWASHILPSFENLIYGGRGTLAAIKAPEGFIKHTGAQQWDNVVHNYHLQLPPPHNMIIIGGAKPLTVHNPKLFIGSDAEDVQMERVPEFYRSWPERDVVDFKGKGEFGLDVEEGGCWTGVYSSSIDSFPFVGKVPDAEGQYIAAGFSGHGMPRILGATAYVVPQMLTELGVEYRTPEVALMFPELPEPFLITPGRLESLKSRTPVESQREGIVSALESAKKSFCAAYA